MEIAPMSDLTTFAGWRIRFYTSDPRPDFSCRCTQALSEALPGADVEVLTGPDDDALYITPPTGTPLNMSTQAHSLACKALVRGAAVVSELPAEIEVARTLRGGSACLLAADLPGSRSQ